MILQLIMSTDACHARVGTQPSNGSSEQETKDSHCVVLVGSRN